MDAFESIQKISTIETKHDAMIVIFFIKKLIFNCDKSMMLNMIIMGKD